MAGRGERRDAALSALKESLVQRFGGASRDTVNMEVDRRLAGRSKLELEDIDAIERAVLAAKRLQRGGGGGSCRSRAPDLSRSAPDLHALHTLRGAGDDATSTTSFGAYARSPARTGRSKRPLGTASRLPVQANSRDSVRVQLAGAAPLSAAAPLSIAGSAAIAGSSPHGGRSYIEPPWGVGATLHEDPPDKKGPFQGKNFVPLPPRMKPLDHFDVIALYDGAKGKEAEDMDLNHNVRAQQQYVKSGLDAQMLEIDGRNQEEQRQFKEDRDEVVASIDRENAIIRKEKDADDARRAKTMAANSVMREEIRQRKQELQDLKKRERDHLQNWLEAEKERREQDSRTQAEEHARFCTTMRTQMLKAIEEERAKKKAERAMDVEMVKAQVAQIDDRAERNRAIVAKRIAIMDRNVATLGAQISERDVRREREEKERLRKHQEDFDRAAELRALKDESDRRKILKHTIETLNSQVKEKSERSLIDQEENRIQLETWRQQLADHNAVEDASKEKARQARYDLDQQLIVQMRENARRHPIDRGDIFALDESLKQQDCALNRRLYERMLKDGFLPEVTSELSQMRHRHKLDPHPSVGRYDMPIDELEMDVPTVG